jgi:hypothetical protein
VAATIIGAYIVNHYITAKSDVPAPAPVAAVSSIAPDSKPAETPADVANIPAAGVRAKGIFEKGAFDKATAEKPQDEKPQDKAQEKDKPQEKTAEKALEKAQDKSDGKPAETASISTDIHRHPALPHEKIRTIPLTAAPSAQPAVSTAVPSNPPSVIEATANPDEHRDANDLAREAIERLRENSPHSQDAARAPDAPRVAGTPQTPSAVQPLPPPVTVAAPAGDTFAPGANGGQQPYPSSAQAYDPNRPIPPADIPSPQPLELRTDTNGAPPLQQHNKNVAEDMLAAAKSVFHAVLPQ